MFAVSDKEPTVPCNPPLIFCYVGNYRCSPCGNSNITGNRKQILTYSCKITVRLLLFFC
jgi:hypothetical protein